MMTRDGTLFEIHSPLGFTVRCTNRYWVLISTVKHPTLAGQLAAVVETLRNPDQIRRSRKDPTVLLFYRELDRRWLSAVVKRENATGFLITAYPTDTPKPGEVLWAR